MLFRSNRSVFMLAINEIRSNELKLNTPGFRILLCTGGSPVMTSTRLIPSSAAPSIHALSAMWFLSRQQRCGRTSMPTSRRIFAAIIRLSARARERGESDTVIISAPQLFNSPAAERRNEQSQSCGGASSTAITFFPLPPCGRTWDSTVLLETAIKRSERVTLYTA